MNITHLQPRAYQLDTVQRTIDSLDEGLTRVCIVAPTGTGKTVMMTKLVHDLAARAALNREYRVLFISHRARLLKQGVDTLTKAGAIAYGEDAGVGDVVVRSVGIMGKIPTDWAWDVVIFDEFHHETCLSVQYRLDQLSQAPIIGLTANKARPDGTLIKSERFIESISREDAIEAGYLSRTEIHSFVETPGVPRTESVLEILREFPNVGSTMIFTRTRAECKSLTSALVQMGLSATSLTSESENEVNRVLSEFEKKTVQFVVSCNKLGEGVDVKGCETAIIARSIGSDILLNQIIGRTVRPDSRSMVYELINPLSADNLSARDIVIEPESHTLHWRVQGQWRSSVV